MPNLLGTPSGRNAASMHNHHFREIEPQLGVFELPFLLGGRVPLCWVDETGELREFQLVSNEREYQETLQRFRESCHREGAAPPELRLLR